MWVASRRGSALAGARLAAELRQARFDLVIDLFCNPRTALWTAATGAAWRVGYPNKRMRSAAYNVPVRTDAVSAIAFHLASLEALGWDARLEVPRARPERRRDVGGVEPPGGAGHPGRRRAGRHAPGRALHDPPLAARGFASLGRTLLAQRPRARLLVFGGPGEEELARSIAAQVADPRAQALVGVALRRFAALLRCAAPSSAATAARCTSRSPPARRRSGSSAGTRPTRSSPTRSRTGTARSTPRCGAACHLDVCDHLSCLRAISPEWVWEVLRVTLERAERGEFVVATPPGQSERGGRTDGTGADRRAGCPSEEGELDLLLAPSATWPAASAPAAQVERLLQLAVALGVHAVARDQPVQVRRDLGLEAAADVALLLRQLLGRQLDLLLDRVLAEVRRTAGR